MALTEGQLEMVERAARSSFPTDATGEMILAVLLELIEGERRLHGGAKVDVDHFVEEAARAWWDANLWPGEFAWDTLVARGDRRLDIYRQRMREALEAVGFFMLVAHHAEHHRRES